ncbi:MAG: FAD-dependent oxidoreductase [Actinomycetota bacterium]|jgi:lycopene beta-cyclase|nr:FAD-dependent oxidoreductase [Rubrobacteraceae bacterium]MDQ3183575.1 FAD-dependent oxidoreductase [Actinomycetota bacterium]MDQ3498456.1 FAD-dependent oxidoreductase [Actinomycetota bacterium]
MDIAILGAGCSGASLAYFLADAGFLGRIHLFDRRTDFSQEQRWCSWGPVPKRLSGLVSASWDRWRIVSGNAEVVCSLPERPYLHVHAPEFYERMHDRLRRHPNVRLHLGCSVESVTPTGLRGEIRRVAADFGDYDVDLVFDGRPSAENMEATRGSGEISLLQSFAGLVVESSEAAFDPDTVTLMDFGAGDSPELSFVYVLPFSAHRALVESTAFSGDGIAYDEHERRVENYLKKLGAGAYTVESRESGCIPMTTRKLPRMSDERHIMIGAAGGATRPSSGYAFVHILRQSETLAGSLMRGEHTWRRPIPRKYGLLDAVFLDALEDSPAHARESFLRMFGRVPTGALVRFLSGDSSLCDDLAVVAALDKTPFVAAAARRVKASMLGAEERR